MSPALGLNDDFLDLLRALAEAEVVFVVVGAHALAVHGVPRATGDLDVLIRPSSENAARLVGALRAFGAPLDAHGVSEHDFTSPGSVYQLGLPPRRIDLLTSLTGVDFDDAWASRVEVRIEELIVPFLGRDALLRNKRATAREKDLGDIELLSRGGSEHE
ncbi:MAG TPA: hypothetical protein VN811_06015 [Thermoanaerobaculia bacterium]|nr:hypothetical protein [Thermoanaerobaculia bacterium]